MEELNKPEELTKPKVSVSTIIISAVLAAVMFGGGVYAYQSNKAKKDQSVLKSQITALQNQKTDLENQVSYESTDSKTYANTTYGFSFKYPKGWVSTKKEGTQDTLAGESQGGPLTQDLVFKVSFYDPDEDLMIGCAYNESWNWEKATPDKTTCDSIQSKLTAEEKDRATRGIQKPDNIFVRIYKKDSAVSLKDWTYSTFHILNSELNTYQVGAEIVLGGEKGYFSDIGCCGNVDRNYVIASGSYVYSLGFHKYAEGFPGTTMPTYFQKVAKTFSLIN